MARYPAPFLGAGVSFQKKWVKLVRWKSTENIKQHMVLLVAVVIGLVSGCLRAGVSKTPYDLPDIRGLWMVFAAYLPQFFAFYLPATRNAIADQWIPIILVSSQMLLLIFAWSNRKVTGFPLLGMGLLLNFIAIVLNGGLMPITPEVLQKIIPPGNDIIIAIGERVPSGKDILLPRESTRLWFLGDILTLPRSLKYQIAFSIGDIVISMGAFWLFWQRSSPHKVSEEVSS